MFQNIPECSVIYHVMRSHAATDLKKSILSNHIECSIYISGAHIVMKRKNTIHTGKRYDNKFRHLVAASKGTWPNRPTFS